MAFNPKSEHDIQILHKVLVAALRETDLEHDALAFAAMSSRISSLMDLGERDFDALKRAAVHAVEDPEAADGH